MLTEKISYITDLEAKLHQKNCECIQLKAFKTKTEGDQLKPRLSSNDLKDCLQNQDIAMMKMLNSVSFDKTIMAKAFMNHKDHQS